MRKYKTRCPVERFWEKVSKGDSCWLWTASKDHFGYGCMGIGSKLDGTNRNVKAHRFAYEMANGPIPEGMHVLHRCDVPSCVRADHLFLGTHDDNMKDMAAKGRSHKTRYWGEGHWNARFSKEQILAIRADSRLQKEIAADYATSQATISAIKTGKKWKYL